MFFGHISDGDDGELTKFVIYHENVLGKGPRRAVLGLLANIVHDWQGERATPSQPSQHRQHFSFNLRNCSEKSTTLHQGNATFVQTRISRYSQGPREEKNRKS